MGYSRGTEEKDGSNFGRGQRLGGERTQVGEKDGRVEEERNEKETTVVAADKQ